MTIKTETEFSPSDQTLTAKIVGEIDHHTVKEARETIDAALLFHRPQTLVLSLSKMGFMDSSGLGLVLGRVASAKAVGATVLIKDADTRALRIMEMAGLFFRDDITVLR